MMQPQAQGQACSSASSQPIQVWQQAGNGCVRSRSTRDGKTASCTHAKSSAMENVSWINATVCNSIITVCSNAFFLARWWSRLN